MLLLALVDAMRPRQWSKNLLVVVAPLAGGRLLEGSVLLRVALAFAIFSMAASSVYLLNDIVDRDRDARHPAKQSRAIASGRLPLGAARALSLTLCVGSVAGAIALGPNAFAGVVGGYLAIMTIYSLRLKHEALYDIVIVASGFLLRAVAGGVVTSTPVSAWFLVTATAGALFLAAGKRSSELAGLGQAGGTRPSLSVYSPSYLRFVWVAAATVTITATAVWALEVAVDATRPGLAQASVAPLSLAVLRYAWWIDAGEAEAPEDVLRRDRSLVALGLAWALLLIGGMGTFG